MSSYDKIYEVVKRIPAGKVATYGQVAEIAGLPRQARLVGYTLHNLKADSDIPWQRVINSKGEISNYGELEWTQYHRILLECEGIKFLANNRINLKIYRWQE